MVAESAKSLAAAESVIKTQLKTAKSSRSNTRFPPGTEYELLNSDAVILHGITHALRYGTFQLFGTRSVLTLHFSDFILNVCSESYMGYVQCLYALNSAHSKFTK